MFLRPILGGGNLQVFAGSGKLDVLSCWPLATATLQLDTTVRNSSIFPILSMAIIAHRAILIWRYAIRGGLSERVYHKVNSLSGIPGLVK